MAWVFSSFHIHGQEHAGRTDYELPDSGVSNFTKSTEVTQGSPSPQNTKSRDSAVYRKQSNTSHPQTSLSKTTTTKTTGVGGWREHRVSPTVYSLRVHTTCTVQKAANPMCTASEEILPAPKEALAPVPTMSAFFSPSLPQVFVTQPHSLFFSSKPRRDVKY